MTKDVGLIYITAPYTHPDPVENTHRAVKAWERLTQYGYTALVPHVSLLLHLINPRPAEFWYAYDIKLLEKCDCIVRLTGESSGADREVKWAKVHNVPVYTMADLIGKRGNFTDEPDAVLGRV